MEIKRENLITKTLSKVMIPYIEVNPLPVPTSEGLSFPLRILQKDCPDLFGKLGMPLTLFEIYKLMSMDETTSHKIMIDAIQMRTVLTTSDAAVLMCNKKSQLVELNFTPALDALKIANSVTIYGYYDLRIDDATAAEPDRSYYLDADNIKNLNDMAENIIKAKKLVSHICDSIITLKNDIGNDEFMRLLKWKEEEDNE